MCTLQKLWRIPATRSVVRASRRICGLVSRLHGVSSSILSSSSGRGGVWLRLPSARPGLVQGTQVARILPPRVGRTSRYAPTCRHVVRAARPQRRQADDHVSRGTRVEGSAALAGREQVRRRHEGADLASVRRRQAVGIAGRQGARNNAVERAPNVHRAVTMPRCRSVPAVEVWHGERFVSFSAGRTKSSG